MKRDRVTLSGATARALFATLVATAMPALTQAQPAQPGQQQRPPGVAIDGHGARLRNHLTVLEMLHAEAVRNCDETAMIEVLDDLRATRTKLKRELGVARVAGQFAKVDVPTLESDLYWTERVLARLAAVVLPKPCIPPKEEADAPPPEPATAAPVVTAVPAPPAVADEDPFEAGRAAVDAGMAPVPPATIPAGDLAGVWLATGYRCAGPQGTEVVRIAANATGQLVATKVVGDNCIPAGEVTWTGTLQGNTIVSRHHVTDDDGSNRRWIAGALTVISRDEIEGFGVRFRRSRTR